MRLPAWYTPPRRPFFKSEVIAEVAQAFKVPVYDMTGPARNRSVVNARAVVAKALRVRGMSTPQIGKTLNRDHSTIVYLLQTFAKRAERSPEMDRVLVRIVSGAAR